jgi:hypothetical protein
MNLNEAVIEAVQVLLTEINAQDGCMARVILYASDGAPLYGLMLVHGEDIAEVMAHLDQLEARWDQKRPEIR